MTCYWWLKRGLGMEFANQYIGMPKQIINIWKNYDKNFESYLKYLDGNNLYGWAMSQKLPVNGFEWVKNLPKFNEDVLKKYDEISNAGYFLEVDIEYSKTLFNSHKDLPFLHERKKVEKVENLIFSIDDKEKYVIHIRA